MSSVASGGPDPVDIAVGSRIRLLRKLQGLSQQALADHCGVTFQQIQKYERGFNRVSASMITKIAQALRVPVADLFEEEHFTSGATHDVSAMLAQPGAIEMLQAFSALPRGGARQALIQFARVFSNSTPAVTEKSQARVARKVSVKNS